MAPRGHHLRRQRAVEALMPLSADQRLNGCQVVKALQDLAVRTVGAAAAALHALRNHGAERVTLFAAPPDAAV